MSVDVKSEVQVVPTIPSTIVEGIVGLMKTPACQVAILLVVACVIMGKDKVAEFLEKNLGDITKQVVGASV